MFIVIICSLLCLLLTFLDSNKQFKGGMKLGFILVTFLAVIHYDYGNDYMAYYHLYDQIIAVRSMNSLFDPDLFRDVGWSAINFVFQYLGGFFSLVAVISIFEGVVYYRAIKLYLPRELWWFGTFIYLISTSFYLLNFSMLRQGLVIAIFVAVYPLIEKRKWLLSGGILFVSSLIHGSALILIPFAFWGFLPVKNGKTLVIILSSILVAMYFSSQFLSTIPQFVFQSTDVFERYEENYAESELTTHFGIGFIIYLIPTILTILFLGDNKTDDSIKRLVALSCIGAFFTPLSKVMPMVGRVGLYFGVYRIIALPVVYSRLHNRVIRPFLTALYFAILLLDYYLFFKSDVFGPHYKVYNTIFSALY